MGINQWIEFIELMLTLVLSIIILTVLLFCACRYVVLRVCEAFIGICKCMCQIYKE
jgi:uncharacterized membrane protein